MILETLWILFLNTRITFEIICKATFDATIYEHVRNEYIFGISKTLGHFTFKVQCTCAQNQTATAKRINNFVVHLKRKEIFDMKF
jgi:hypothetical protein